MIVHQLHICLSRKNLEDHLPSKFNFVVVSPHYARLDTFTNKRRLFKGLEGYETYFSIQKQTNIFIDNKVNANFLLVYS